MALAFWGRRVNDQAIDHSRGEHFVPLSREMTGFVEGTALKLYDRDALLIMIYPEWTGI
jgi:hypothetical protein